MLLFVFFFGLCTWAYKLEVTTLIVGKCGAWQR